MLDAIDECGELEQRQPRHVELEIDSKLHGSSFCTTYATIAKSKATTTNNPPKSLTARAPEVYAR